MQKSVSLHEFLNTWKKIEDTSPPPQHVRFTFSPLFFCFFSCFISLHHLCLLSCHYVTVSLFPPSFYTFIKDGCRAEKHNRFYKKICWNVAELGRQNPNFYRLYMFVHRFFLYFFTWGVFLRRGLLTVASKKRSFSVTTAASVTLSPHRAAEPQFGEDSSVLVTAKNHRAASWTGGGGGCLFMVD